MTKKISLNGIELSLPNYNSSAVTIFDYLENVVTHLEDGLGNGDGNFELSINVDFSTTNSPKHKILSNGTAKKQTKDKVAKILDKTSNEEHGHASGSVRVDLLVEDR